MRKVAGVMADRLRGPSSDRQRMYARCAAYAAMLLAIAASASALAETDQNVAWCKRQGNPTPEQQIAGCTALIEGGKVHGRERALSYFRRGAAYLMRQAFDRAIRDFSDGLALDPANATAFYGRALAYEGKKDPDRAIKDYDAAIRLDPGHVKALGNRAAIYTDQRAYERALEEIGRAH